MIFQLKKPKGKLNPIKLWSGQLVLGKLKIFPLASQTDPLM